MILAGLDVLIRWTDDSIGITGWGWFALVIIVAAISDIGSKK